MAEISVDPGFDALSYGGEPETPVSARDEGGVRSLWCHVIRQALTDLSVAAGGSREGERLAAERWFFDASNDFGLVCHLAGVHPETIRRGAGLVREGRLTLFVQTPGRRR